MRIVKLNRITAIFRKLLSKKLIYVTFQKYTTRLIMWIVFTSSTTSDPIKQKLNYLKCQPDVLNTGH